jgi:hypothetical protein
MSWSFQDHSPANQGPRRVHPCETTGVFARLQLLPCSDHGYYFRFRTLYKQEEFSRTKRVLFQTIVQRLSGEGFTLYLIKLKLCMNMIQQCGCTPEYLLRNCTARLFLAQVSPASSLIFCHRFVVSAVDRLEANAYFSAATFY